MRGNFSKVWSGLGRLVVRWLECLGENPPFSRDHGIHAWRYLHQPRPRRPVTRPMAITRPVRALYLVPAETPGPDGDFVPLRVEDGEFPRGEVLKSGRYRDVQLH